MASWESWWEETVAAIAAIAEQAQGETTDSLNQWFSQSLQTLDRNVESWETELDNTVGRWWERRVGPFEEAIDRTLEEWEVQLQPWMAPFLDWHLDEDTMRAWDETDQAVNDVMLGVLTALGLDLDEDNSSTLTDEALWNEIAPKTEPRLDWHPACIGCEHFHGRTYGNNILICAMHPYGVEGDRCSDWSNSTLEP